MSNRVNLTLDVTKTGIQNPLIKVRQGDGGFETLRTTVTSNGEPLDLQGWTVTFMGTTAGNHKIVDGNVTLVEAPNGIFDYTPSKVWGMDIGEFKIAYFKFVNGDGTASSANFRVNVIEAVDLTQEEARDYISVVDATILEVREHLESSLADVTASVAATSSAASSLSVNVSSVASSAVNDINSSASNASSVASSATSNVSSVAFSAVSEVTSAASSASSAAESAFDKLNNLSIGGRNLLLNTSKSFIGVGRSLDNGDFNSQGGQYYLAGGKTVAGLYNQYGPSQYLTLSFDWEASGDNISGQFNPQWFGTPWLGLGTSGDIKPSNTNKSGHYTKTVQLNSGGYSTGEATSIMIRQDYLQGTITIKNMKLEAGNVASDWTPAPEDADNEFIKKSNELPAEARDFNYLAKHMQEYQGYWFNNFESIPNAPAENWNWSVIEVIPGNSDSNGLIRTMRTGDGIIYSTSVNFGYVQHWTRFADDANTVHNTGNETVAGDKTFTGKLSATTFTAGGDNYTNTASVDVNYLGATISFVRIGKLVTFTSGVSAFNTNVSAGLTSNVIPNGFKPAVQQNISTANQNIASNFFSFDQGGGIYSYGTYPSGAQPRLSWTYITTDAWPV